MRFATLLLSLLTISASFTVTHGQTGTATILNQPCNLDDGAVAVDISGFSTPPNTEFTYYYSIDGWFNYIEHTSTVLADTAFNLPACYSVSIVSSTGEYAYISVGMSPPISIDWPQVTNPICPDVLASVELTVDSGDAPFEIEWFEYDTLSGLGASLGMNNPINLDVSYSYAAIIGDASGCSTLQIIPGENYQSYLGGDTSLIFAITEFVIYTSSTDASCTNGQTAVDSVVGGVAPYTYSWVNGANGPALTGLQAGFYEVEVTDSEGCSDIGYGYVQQSPIIQTFFDVTDATCLQNDGEVMAFGSGGQPPYTYAWSNGMNTQQVSNLQGGEWLSVIATDVNSCVGSGSVNVGTFTPITVTYTATPSDCNVSNGEAVLNVSNGTPPYEITWATFPTQTGFTANGLGVGAYQFTVVDAVGCVRTGSVHVQSTSELSGYVLASNVQCPNTTGGSLSVVASGTNPPFTYQWSNGSTATTQTNMPVGGYSCTITDTEGCSIVKHGHIGVYSPVHVGINVTPASCLYTCDGEVFANATGGTPPYTYSSSVGQTTQTTTGWCEGPNKHVWATDANGCSDGRTFTMPYNTSADDCYCTIKGKVYEDLNGNCQYDNGEPPMNHVMIHCSGYGYRFTDGNGNYAFRVPAGDYTITENILAFYPLAPCQQNGISVNVPNTSSGCEYTVDFANEINPIHDLHVVHMNASLPPIPGHDYTLKTVIRNDGTITESNITVGFAGDGQLLYNGSGPIAFSQQNPIDFPNWYSITGGLGSINPGGSAIINTDYAVPTNIPLETEVLFKDTAAHDSPMSTYLLDYSPWDNTNQIARTVIGSYDPNYVEVDPRGLGVEGFIERTDSILDYTIHFQNTGSYYAQNIFILDTLDDHLDLLTFRPGYSDYDYTVEISEDRVVRFNFDNIHLPWQAMTEYGSRGLVSYSIRQIEDLPIGTEINATAGIYFDYNEPVITNTTLNTIGENVSITEYNGFDDEMRIFPNPASNILNIQFSDNRIQPNSISVYDMMGRMVLEQPFTTRLDVSNLSFGTYVVTILSEQEIYWKKVIIAE